MMLDASTVAKAIRHTVLSLKTKSPKYKTKPEKSILDAFDELADTFENLTNQRMSEKRKPSV